MVGKYNARDLTYEQDALPAIWGLLSVLNRSFEGGFLQGLPEMFFDVALRTTSLAKIVIDLRDSHDPSLLGGFAKTLCSVAHNTCATARQE